MNHLLPVLFAISLSVAGNDADYPVKGVPEQSGSEEASLEIIDPRGPQFQADWNQMVEATCPETDTQPELAHVVTLRVETLAASYAMLSDITLSLIELHTEAKELLGKPIAAEERTVIIEFQENYMEPALERFSAELNRAALWIESAEYEQRVLSEGRHGTDTEPEQIQTRCYHEFDAALHEYYRMHDFVLDEMAKLEAQSTYLKTRNIILIRLGRIQDTN